MLDDKEKEVLPDKVLTVWLGGVTDSVGAAPAWVTVTTTGDSPGTVTVTFATLCETVEFWEYVAVSVPFPLPEGVTVHHV